MLGDSCVAITSEFENLPVESLVPGGFLPGASGAVVAMAQDRLREKTFLDEHEFPTAPLAIYDAR